MGVYIKGVEMPISGHILIVFPSGRVLEVSADATQNIFKETQAFPIPQHGRLIDADALMDSDEDLWDGMWGYSGAEIMNAPTIIPAEEDET